MKTFANSIDMVKHSEGVVGEHPKLGKYMLKLNRNESINNTILIADSVTQSTEAYLAHVFIARANHWKYATLLEDLSNTYAWEKDEYPKTLVGTHKLLVTWENKSSQSQE
eukprot:15273817-Ditylum_brightwellii.AAC.1